MGWIAASLSSKVVSSKLKREIGNVRFSVPASFPGLKIQTDRRHGFPAYRRACLFLRKQLLQELLHGVVGHDAGVGIRLALAMKVGGRCLIDAVHLAEREVLVNQRREGAALDERSDFVPTQS